MKKIIPLYKELLLKQLNTNNINEFHKFIYDNSADIINNNMRIGLRKDIAEIQDFFSKNTINDCVIYAIYKNDLLIGFITMGEWIKLSEISFYLNKDNRDIKTYCENKFSFSKLVEIFLTEFFADKNDDHIIMWGTRYSAVVSQHIAAKLSFAWGYEVMDKVVEFKECPIKTFLFFSNKKIFFETIKNSNKELLLLEYSKLFDKLSQIKCCNITQQTYDKLKNYLNLK